MISRKGAKTQRIISFFINDKFPVFVMQATARHPEL
jgi:hypothetical protein